MRLEALLAGVEVLAAYGPNSLEVKQVSLFPNDVRPGDMFVSLPHPDRLANGIGGAEDRCVAAAAEAGVIVSDDTLPPDLTFEGTWVQVKDLERSVERIFCAYHGRPSQALRVAGVTGTNGKTTTAFVLHHILCCLGRSSGLISTIEAAYGELRLPMPYTTLAPGRLHALLARMRSMGASDVVLEVTSHALSFSRLEACDVDVAGFTNLSQDHLDFHGSMKSYADAKWKLFECHAKAACFHVGDATGQAFSRRFRGAQVTVASSNVAADLTARCIIHEVGGSKFVVDGKFGRASACLPLPGMHNVQNALVAIGMACLLGHPLDRVVASLATAHAPPGRLQRVATSPQVYVDYAHTPDGLRAVLQTARRHCVGRLIVVFGAGGERDQAKRPQMGAMAHKLSDVIVLTSDNPRREDPLQIIDDIARGITPAASLVKIADRRQAIYQAIAMTGPQDLLIVAGRGHEQSQDVGGHLQAFCDVAVIKEEIARLRSSGRSVRVKATSG